MHSLIHFVLLLTKYNGFLHEFSIEVEAVFMKVDIIVKSKTLHERLIDKHHDGVE